MRRRVEAAGLVRLHYGILSTMGPAARTTTSPDFDTEAEAIGWLEAREHAARSAGERFVSFARSRVVPVGMKRCSGDPS